MFRDVTSHISGESWPVVVENSIPSHPPLIRQYIEAAKPGH